MRLKLLEPHRVRSPSVVLQEPFGVFTYLQYLLDIVVEVSWIKTENMFP